jgi:hypothetical protein
MSDQGETEPGGQPETSRQETSRPGGGVRRAVALVAAAVAVVGAAGAGFATGSMVGGGGTQPEDVLPATAVAFADLDLDPPAGQKLNIARLLGRLPEVKDEYGPEPDLRELVVRTALGGTPLVDADLEQWMGDRLGVALVPDDTPDGVSGGVTAVLALQVSDADGAVDDLVRLLGPDRVAVSGDYVVVTGVGGVTEDLAALSSQEAGRSTAPTARDVVAAAEGEALGDSETFTDAFSHLEDGFATLYVDGDALADLGRTPGSGPGAEGALGAAAVGGRSAAVLRAEPNAVELTGWSTTPLPGDGRTATLATGLPEQTVIALEGTGGAELVAERWQQLVGSVPARTGGTELDRRLAQVEAQLGIALPEDLQTIAGLDAVVAVDGSSMLTGVPGAGVRSVTDAAAATDLAGRLQQSLAELTGGLGIVAASTDDGLVVATSADYAQVLSAGDGGLGGSARFVEALPDAADARYLAWVDLAALSGPLLLAAPESAATLAPLDSLGVTVGPAMSGDDGTAVRARLVFAEDDS